MSAFLRTALAAAGLAAPLTAQTVLLYLAPPAGQVSQYRMVSEVRAKSPGASAVPMMRQEMYATQTVTRAAGEIRELTMRVDSVRAEMRGMTELGPDLSSLWGARVEMRMDTRGRTLGTRFDDATLPAEMRETLSQLRQSMGLRTPTLLERPVRVEDTWQGSTEVALGLGQGPAGPVQMRLLYRNGTPRSGLLPCAGGTRLV